MQKGTGHSTYSLLSISRTYVCPSSVKRFASTGVHTNLSCISAICCLRCRDCIALPHSTHSTRRFFRVRSLSPCCVIRRLYAGDDKCVVYVEGPDSTPAPLVERDCIVARNHASSTPDLFRLVDRHPRKKLLTTPLPLLGFLENLNNETSIIGPRLQQC